MVARENYNDDARELPLFIDDCDLVRSGSHLIVEGTVPEQSPSTRGPSGDAAKVGWKAKDDAIIVSSDYSIATSGELTNVDPLNCEPFFGAPRAGTEFLDSRDGDLATNVAKNGVLEPIIVWPAGQKFRVLSGNRRLAVVKHLCELGTIVELPARMFDGDEVAALTLAHACNQGREKPTAMEQAKSVAWALNNMDRTQVEISRALGFNEAKVSRLLTLANLPDFIIGVATEPNLLSENFAALLQGALKHPEQLKSMKVRAGELKTRNVNLGGPQLARYLLNGDQAPAVHDVTDETGEVIGRLSCDQRGAIQLKVNPTYLQADVALKPIINALAFSLHDLMVNQRKKGR